MVPPFIIVSSVVCGLEDMSWAQWDLFSLALILPSSCLWLFYHLQSLCSSVCIVGEDFYSHDGDTIQCVSCSAMRVVEDSVRQDVDRMGTFRPVCVVEEEWEENPVTMCLWLPGRTGPLWLSSSSPCLAEASAAWLCLHARGTLPHTLFRQRQATSRSMEAQAEAETLYWRKKEEEEWKEETGEHACTLLLCLCL